MSHLLPAIFVDRLAKIIPTEQLPAVLESFSLDKAVSVRVNTLLAEIAPTLASLQAQGFSVQPVPWFAAAFSIPATQKLALTQSAEFYAGAIYIQNFSSMLPVLALAPEAGEINLDLAAAPGGKTTLMAALMHNQGQISAVEPVRDRFFRMQSNLSQQGVQNTKTYLMDGRSVGVKCPARFDRILLDAPCSSEARFDTRDEKSMAHWHLAKVKECAHKQKRLLHAAIIAAKVGAPIVYSTCSFSPEENEAIIAAQLKTFGASLEIEPIAPLASTLVQYQAGLTAWGKKTYPDSLVHAVRVLPNVLFDGFFMCKLRKLA